MKRAAILGASGYAGGELIRFLDAHPFFDVVFLGARTSAGRALGDVHPNLTGGGRQLQDMSELPVSDVDIVFLALPHGASAEPAMRIADAGVKVVDLGSDFRLDTPDRYLEAYGSVHPFPDQLGAWAYGVPELFAGDISGASRVAAPGCYPTSAVLGLAPLVAAGLIESDGIIVDSMSGVSGAGRSGSDRMAFGVIDESVKAYNVLTHRHRPEMERALDLVGMKPASVMFTPHLVPIQRGILSTIYADTTSGATEGDLHAALDEAYASAPFVKRTDVAPETRWVVGSNNALISAQLDERSGRAVILVAIDNLVKGASGQAVQCANLMYSLDETAGLPMTGWMP